MSLTVTEPVQNQQPLWSVLSALSKQSFVFVRPGGNWGDQLIYLGADYLATQLGLSYRTVDFDQFNSEPVGPNEIIYLHGGGGYTLMAKGRAPRSLRKALQTPGATIIQGPCTLSDDAHGLLPLQEDLNAMRAARLIFFTRERQSAELAALRLPSSVEQYVNDDTAFYLNREVLLNKVGRVRARTHLVAVREDSEAVQSNGVPDRSKCIIDPAYYARSFDHWIRIHAACKTIVTNRTHTAVCGAIFGIPTTLFGGAYHKNRSIWEFSLEKRGVEWLTMVDGVPQRPKVDPLLAWIPIRSIRESWRLDRLAKYAMGIPLS